MQILQPFKKIGDYNEINVQTETLDNFCKNKNIVNIDKYLRRQTETFLIGHELTEIQQAEVIDFIYEETRAKFINYLYRKCKYHNCIVYSKTAPLCNYLI